MLFKKTQTKAATSGRTVYRRRAPTEDASRAVPSGRERGRVAPTLTPLLIGFALLLLLVALLGALSLRRLDRVNVRVTDAERAHADQLQMLLNLRSALTQVNNAARARFRSEARGFVPPLNADYRHAREDALKLLQQFERLPLAETTKWKKFKRDAEEFLGIADDMTQFSLLGYEKFRALDNQLNEIFQDTQREHDAIERENENLRERAAHDIQVLTLLALITGAFVALGAILEAQRRFRQLRRTLDIVRRERQFSAQILEGMVSAVAAIDAEQRLRSANDAFLALFPFARIGAPLISAHMSDAPPHDACALNAATEATSSSDSTSEASNEALKNSSNDSTKEPATEKRALATEAIRLLQNALKTPVKTATYHGRWQLAAVPREDIRASNLPLAAQINQSAMADNGAARQTPNGELRTFDVYSSPLEIDGAAGWILTLVDVTEAARAEEELRQQASLAAVGQATAQVAHEIKNPLGSIRLGVAMLREMTDNHQAISTIDLVERGIEHLNKLTRDVTQFSRRARLELAPHDLQEVLESSLHLVADRLREKNIEVRKRYDAARIIVECDEDQMRQVFVNLFVNAIDASPKDSALEVVTRIAPAYGEQYALGGSRAVNRIARVSIIDYGAGMDEATCRRIFEPFFTTKKRGTGLGLAIVKKIIEQHGGRIAVESAPGAGTTFTLDLPLSQDGATL